MWCKPLEFVKRDRGGLNLTTLRITLTSSILRVDPGRASTPE